MNTFKTKIFIFTGENFEIKNIGLMILNKHILFTNLNKKRNKRYKNKNSNKEKSFH